MRRNSRSFLPILILFIVLNGFFITGGTLLQRWDADREVLIIGNGMLFFITALSYFISIRGLKHPNPNAFMRSVYTSLMMKLFLCAIAAIAYIATHGKNINKPALFTLMGLYLVYTFLEVSVLTKSLRKENG
jgi:hypothetical protein